MTQDQAKRAVDAIVFDLTDRGGLRGVWDDIDEPLRQEIRQKWAELIVAAAEDPTVKGSNKA